MILGIVTLLLFTLECSYGLWKKAGRGRISPGIMRSGHKVIGIVTVVVSFVHLALVLGLWKQRPVIMLVSGALAMLCIMLTGILGLGKMNKAKIKYHKLLAVIAVLCLCVHVYSGMTSFAEYTDAAEEIQISDVNVDGIKDGLYQGEYSIGYVYARVRVTVAEGTITKIDLLEHGNERGEPAEKIIDTILAEQSLDVDVVSGATNSSNVIKKAVKNALESE